MFKKDIKKLIALFIIGFVLVTVIGIVGAVYKLHVLAVSSCDYKYYVQNDFSAVTYYDETFSSINSLPDNVNEDTAEVSYDYGRFPNQSNFDLAYRSKEKIYIHRYETENTVYLKLELVPDKLITFNESENENPTYYFEKVK